MSGNNQRPLGKSPLADAIFENIKSQSDAFAAASKAGLEQGRAIGRREMKPLIRELVKHLRDNHSPSHSLLDVVAQAEEALENEG